MLLYRIYRYDAKELPYRHIQLYRDRALHLLPTEKAEPTPHDGRMDESLSRTRRIIRDTLLCNRFMLFCTFTFSPDKVPDRYDFQGLRKSLSQFFNNYRKRHDPNFRYLFVPEHHKDGAIHFHGVTTFIRDLVEPGTVWKRMTDGTLQQVPNTKHYLDWPAFSSRYGYFSCSRIRDNDRCATYVSKYITKELTDWGKGCQLVLKSKGLNKPELVYDSDTDFLQLHPNDIDNEWCRSAWADEAYTARFYKHWSYRGDEVVPWEDRWKYVQWPAYEPDEKGCVPMTAEQLEFLRENSQGVI